MDFVGRSAFFPPLLLTVGYSGPFKTIHNLSDMAKRVLDLPSTPQPLGLALIQYQRGFRAARYSPSHIKGNHFAPAPKFTTVLECCHKSIGSRQGHQLIT